MKLLVVLLVVVSFASVYGQGSGLKCVTCHGASSFEGCDSHGERQCHENQNSCETVVRRNKEKLFVIKGCKQTMACKNNQMQNGKPTSLSTQCNEDQDNSFCTCCCEGDLCNAGADTCSSGSVTSIPTGNDCPAPPNMFPYGNVNCEGGICKYECTSPTYEIWPAGRTQNVCGANGKWQFETPCCARSCPPYFLYDTANLYTYRQETIPLLTRVLESFIPTVDIGPESVMMSSLVFGQEVRESSIVNFNDYGGNATRLHNLIRTNLKFTESEIVNMGAAIQYAIDNLLTSEKGMRDSRVPKALIIHTDSNASDDAKTAAENARRLGYLVYVFFFERDGVVIDDQLLLDITGDQRHIFKFGPNFVNLPQSWFDDLTTHFCDDPCKYVLRDNE